MTDKMFGIGPYLHGLSGMGDRPCQHCCKHVAQEVTAISMLTSRTPWLRPLSATWSQRAGFPH